MTQHRLNQEMATRSPHIKPPQADRLSALSALSGGHISSMPTLGTQLRNNHPYKYDGCAIRSQQEPTNRNPGHPKCRVPHQSGIRFLRHPEALRHPRQHRSAPFLRDRPLAPHPRRLWLQSPSRLFSEIP